MALILSPRAEAAGYRLATFDTIGSTNAEARTRALAGDRGPLWIVAREQTAGRGRRGRDWQTVKGNFAATLLVSTRVPLGIAATLGFVAGLAVVEAVSLCAPSLAGRLQLKWPNDVLADQAKLGGILLESEAIDDGLAIMIGIGLNILSAPHDLPYPATSLSALDTHVQTDGLFTAVSEAWIDFARIWNEGRGVGEILSRWRGHAAGIGAPIVVRLGERVVEGVFETLDEQGRLVLRGANNLETVIAAGDVHFGAAATVRPEIVV